MPQRFEAILIGACESQRVEASVCSHLVARSGVILSFSPQSESSTYISSSHLIPEWGISIIFSLHLITRSEVGVEKRPIKFTITVVVIIIIMNIKSVHTQKPLLEVTPTTLATFYVLLLISGFECCAI